jgi:tetratricopeptide (TPR) repeat protein
VSPRQGILVNPERQQFNETAAHLGSPALKGHTSTLVEVAFAPDGNTLATASADGTVKLWRAADDSEASARKSELDPNDPDSPAALINEGDRLQSNGRFDAAAEVYGKAKDRLAKLAAAFPKESYYRDSLARTHLALGRLLGSTRQTARAAAEFRLAISIWDKMGADLPNEPLYRGHVAYIYGYDLAPLLSASNRPREAEEALRQSVAGFENVAAKLPEIDQNYLTQCRINLAVLLAANGRSDEAEKQFRQEISRWERLAAEFPNNAEYQTHVANCHSQLGGFYAELNDWDKAYIDFAQVVKLAPGASAPDYYKLALLCLARQDAVGYRKACTSMLEHFDQSAGVEGTFWVIRTFALAPGAVTDWTKPLKMAEEAHAAEGKNYQTSNNLGAMLYRAGRFKEAAERLSEAGAAVDAPSNGTAIVYNWFFQAMAQHRLGDMVAAAKWLEKAVREIDKPPPNTGQNPPNDTWNRRLTLRLLRSEAEELLAKKK